MKFDQKISDWFEKFAIRAAKATGSGWAFILACAFIIIWLLMGPVTNYSEAWQLSFSLTTTIITFLMVFLIRKIQNKNSIALQVKLNELVAAHDKASNKIISIEDLTEDEIVEMNEHYSDLAEITNREENKKVSRSIEDTGHTGRNTRQGQSPRIKKKIDDRRSTK